LRRFVNEAGASDLAEPYATVLSHLVGKDLLEIEEMVLQGL
jgi:hypothetical protein